MTELTTRYGSISVPNQSDDLIQKSLTLHGEWAYTEQFLLASLLSPNEAFWDGGAFLGTFGLGVAQIAAQLGHTPSSLVAVEPDVDTNLHLMRNLEANCPCPFRIATCAISEKPQRLKVKSSVDHSANLGARAYEEATKSPFNSPTVEGWPLSELRKEYGNYTCLKLDIENMELQALRGDFNYIRDTKPTLWIECNEDKASLKVHEAMCALGYDPVYVAFPAFQKDNFNSQSDLIYPMVYEAALVGASFEKRSKLKTTAKNMPVDIIMRQVPDAWKLRQALWNTPRWTMSDWSQMSKAELIAVLGRMHRNEDLDSFLNDSLALNGPT